MTNPDLPSNSKFNPGKPSRETEKKVEKVVQGDVVRRKKPLSRRFMDTFVEGEAKGVGHYVVFNVIIPAVKDVISDVVSQGIERMLYGDKTSPSRRGGYRPNNTTPYTSYNKPGGTPPWKREERPVSRQARATHNFDEIVLDTRAEAEDVINHMYELIERYQQVTVSDLYDLVGIGSAFTDERWGWTDLTGSGVTRTKGGYLLDLPKPDPLD